MNLKIIFNLIFLTVLSGNLLAQKNGYMGKKLILKTQPFQFITGDLAFQVEYAIFRHISLTANWASKSYYKRFVNLKDSELKVNDKLIGYRIYINPEQAAPSGSYQFLSVGFGSGNAKGETKSISNNYFPYGYQNLGPDFKIKNIRTINAKIGFGYQQIYLRRLSLDFSLS